MDILRVACCWPPLEQGHACGAAVPVHHVRFGEFRRLADREASDVFLRRVCSVGTGMRKAVPAPVRIRRIFHCWAFDGSTEVLDEQGGGGSEGEEGEIVGTSFHAMATPFIRYRTMDMAVKGPAWCPDCGRNFQILNYIMDELQEVIVMEDGSYISDGCYHMHSGIFDALRQFQFLQEKPGRVVLRYVAKNPPLSRKEE